jgi:tetratricopeptide (TPR) repeat protein
MMNQKVVVQHNRKIFLAGLCVILVFTGMLYRASLKGEFLAYDDTENVVNNPMVRNLSLATLPQFFQSEKLYMFTPLTFLSYAIDFKIGGMDPYVFRLSNLLLHLLNVLLVFILATQFLKKSQTAIFVALLFAVHPMNVDSVAWISARSNLLAGSFILLSLICYNRFTEKYKYGYLALSVLTYVLSLLSKPSGVLLPFFIFIIDLMAQRKWSARMVMEKAPYFAFGLFSGLITLFFRTDSGSAQFITAYSFIDRIFMTFYSLDGYLTRAIIPAGLSEIYAYPMKNGGFLPILYYLSPAVFIVLAAVIVLLKRSGNLPKQSVPCLLMFFLLIIPTQVVLLEDGYMANRYGYIPLTGIFILVVASVDRVIAGFPVLKPWLVSVAIIPIFVFSGCTFYRSQAWRTTLTLFDHAISRSPDAAFAYNSRGMAKYTIRDFEGAMADYNEAIRLNPVYAGCYYNRGIVFYSNQRYEEAFQDYSKAIGLNPQFASCYDARGILYMDVIRNDSLALADYNQAIRYNPGFAQAYFNRGILQMRRQNPDAACSDFRKVRQLGYNQADELIGRYCR